MGYLSQDGREVLAQYLSEFPDPAAVIAAEIDCHAYPYHKPDWQRSTAVERRRLGRSS